LVNKIAHKAFERNLSLKTNLVLINPYSANLPSRIEKKKINIQSSTKIANSMPIRTLRIYME
jgi:hypothetical protein